VADIDDAGSEIVIVVHWPGVHSEIRLRKRRRGQRNSTPADVIAQLMQPKRDKSETVKTPDR
jgi:hypothetical protein